MKGNKVIIGFCVFAVLFFVANIAWSHDYYHTKVIENTTVTYVTKNYNADRVIAKSTASGQHHYKATTQLQWSVGAGFSGDESALSFGLGLQTGKIFWSANITDSIFSGESAPVVGVSASGTF